MKFCPTCANLLLVEKVMEGLRLYCKTCPYIYLIDHPIIEKMHLQRKKVEVVFGGEEAWDNVAQADATCPKCENTRAYYKQL